MATWALLDTNASHAPRRSIAANETAAEGVPGATDGLSLEGVAGFTLYAACGLGETWNAGTAVLKAWRYDPMVGVMSRAAEHDVTVGTDAVGQRAIAVAFSVASPRGRICHIWDGTGVTGGNVTVSYTASMLVGVKA